MTWSGASSGEHFVASNPALGNGYVVAPAPSGDSTGAADYASLQALVTSAGAKGQTVILQLGSYYLNNHMLWDQTNAGVGVFAPSILGWGCGPTADKSLTAVTELVASTTFPIGEFLIDYLGPTANDTQISGFEVGKFSMRCQARAAGVRTFNQTNAFWHDITINGPAPPAPANNQGTPDGAFNCIANPSFNAYFNHLERIDIFGAGAGGGHSGFYLMEGSGSLLTAIDCSAYNLGQFGWNVGSYTKLIGCSADRCGTSTTGYPNWNLTGVVTMTDCFDVNQPNGSSFQIKGSAFGSIRIIGGRFTGTATNSTGGEAANALVYLYNPNLNVKFIGCDFLNPSGFMTDWIYFVNSATGNVDFSGCSFAGTAPTTAFYNLNGLAPGILSIQNCRGANPEAIQTPTEAVLVSGVPLGLGTRIIPAALTAARVVGAILNPIVGTRVVFTIVQGGAGGFAVTFNAVYKFIWSDAGNTVGKRSSIAGIYDGTNWNQDGAQTPYV